MSRMRGLIPSLALAAGACAHASPPPGGEIEPVPPMLVASSPEHLSVVQPGNRPVVFRFDRRISEQGIDDLVSVSPATGEVRVDRGRTELRVRLRGGWQPGQVYRVVVQPGLRDLWGNERRHPVEVVFSTGPGIEPTAVAGIVTDRITGRPLPPPTARIEAIREADSTVYVAMADADGMFAMRYLPAGRYKLVAYGDQNRNQRLDPFERRAEASVEIEAADTAMVALAVLAPDSTPARLVRAEAQDSVRVVLTFDDYVDPVLPLTGVTVALRRLPDGVAVPVDTLLFPHEHREWLAARRAEAGETPDTAAVDAPDPADPAVRPDAAPLDPPRRAAPPGRGDPAAEPEPIEPAPADPDPAAAGDPRGEPRDRAPASPLPVRELIIVPAEPLEHDTRYEVEIRGVVNLWGLGDGGGEAEFETRPAPPPPADPDPDPDPDAGDPDPARPGPADGRR